MKICCKCKSETDDFSFKNKSTGSLSSYCRACMKTYRKIWYAIPEANSRQREKVKANNVRYRIEGAGKLFEYLSSHPCVDCGEQDHVVLEFDHRDPAAKKMSVCLMVKQGYSWKAVMEEICKCDVRCANCHRRKTATQFNWLKSTQTVLYFD